jgi:hypothetical protein
MLIGMLCLHGASAQTALINGTNAPATLPVNTTNGYTLTASTGDNIVLRLGSAGFEGRLELYGPTGALLESVGGNSTDWPLSYTATNSGTFIVLVSSYYAGGSGSYVLHLAQFPEPFVVPAGDEGGPMANGGNHTGTLTLGDLDMWTFSANAGDNVVLRLGSTNFEGRLDLYGPNGAWLKSVGGNSTDWTLSYTATNTGTFTVLVSSYYVEFTGTYALHLAQFPEAFIVPPGDEGGAMTNGGNHTGKITLGDLDMWTFTANTGDNVVLRLGSTNFDGNLNLYGPNGAFLKTVGGNSTDWVLTYTATNSGTFTVLVSSYYAGDTGTYVLHLAQFPEPFIVPPGDEGGPMTNGANHAGTITLGDLDMWTFAANAGDNVVLRLGSTGFEGNLNLYGPDGAFLKTVGGNSTDWVLAYTATNSGTFTVLVSSYYAGDTGTYVLYLAQFPEPFIVPPGDEGGPMTNGANHAGTITLGDLDMWTFAANAGDNVVLRLGSVGFEGNLNLYGPNGAFLKTVGGDSTDWVLTYTATNSGTFTMLVSSYYPGNTGTYVLYLAQFPEPFIVPPGDEGGPMANGGNYGGTITLGDLDMWTFTANTGDNVVLRLGSTGFEGNLNLYGPNGAFLKTAGGDSTDWVLTYTATNSGTFTVLVSSYYAGNTGTYVLHLAQFPEAFIVPGGDQGGSLTGSANYTGTINIADLDPWRFTACAGDIISLQLNTTNFYGNLGLYGPSGALLKTIGGNTTLNLSYLATNCGTFGVLVSSYYAGGTGTYGLTAAGLTYGPKLCRPVIAGTQLTLNGVGGDPAAAFTLYSTTNVALPFSLWTHILTNLFDPFGVLTYTNAYNPAARQLYYRFIEMK